MLHLAEKILRTTVHQDHVAVFFMGQIPFSQCLSAFEDETKNHCIFVKTIIEMD